MILVCIFMLMNVLKKLKPEIRYVSTKKEDRQTVSHMKDVYQEAWEGDPIIANKRTETIK